MGETKYIDAMALIDEYESTAEWLQESVDAFDRDEWVHRMTAVRSAQVMLAIVPEAKVRPLVEAEWEERDVEVQGILGTITQRRFYCGACGKWQSWGKTKWCPGCGAKMMNGPEGKQCSD